MKMRALVAAGVYAAAAAAAVPAHAQMADRHHGDTTIHAMPGAAAAQPAPGVMPTLPGQDAFGAIQEIVRILESDPNTDWSKVDLRALRSHLIDMNEVTLRAAASERPVPGGLEILVTGGGRTLEAIRRMVPAHGHELNQINGWRADVAPVANGVRLTVTSADPREVAHIRGLGFIGIMVSGSHHQPHHLAMARGEFRH